MLTVEEASLVYKYGEESVGFPILRGKVDIPQSLVSTLDTIPFEKAQILVADIESDKVNGRYRLKGVDSESRKSFTYQSKENDFEEYYLFWKKVGKEYVEEWLRKFPKYLPKDLIEAPSASVIKYVKGDYFNLHSDGGNFNYYYGGYKNPVWRVLMIIIGLTPKEEYEGGQLKFPSEGENGTFKVDLGDIICFPAPMRHMVEPIEKGTRCIIVGQYFAEMPDINWNVFDEQFQREDT